MFDFIERSVRTAANVATLPVSLMADAVTCGGMFVDRDESYTETKARRIAKEGRHLLDDVAG